MWVAVTAVQIGKLEGNKDLIAKNHYQDRYYTVVQVTLELCNFETDRVVSVIICFKL